MRISKLLTIACLLVNSFYSCDKTSDNLSNFDLENLKGTWYLNKFIDKQDKDTYYLPDTYKASISFYGENCIVVIGPCNSGKGVFDFNGNKVTVNELSLTERGCQILGYEKTFTSNLSGIYIIKEDTLKITSDYDTDLIFTKSDTTVHYPCCQENLNINLIIDSLNCNRYYSTEVFNTQNLLIYGKWILTGISGGLHGSGYEADFDYFEVKSIGIYGLIRNDSILEFGKIEIDEQTNENLLINLIPDTNSDIFLFDSEKYVYFSNIDSLELRAPCCDRFNYHFIRNK